jgi:hypothetical protein
MKVHLQKAYNNAPVTLFRISEAMSFEDAWASMASDISMVVLLGHGNHETFRAYSVYGNNGKVDQNSSIYLFPDDIGGLASKNIKTVFIAGCQSTNADTTVIGEDVASAFLQISGVESVVAFNGACDLRFYPNGYTIFSCGNKFYLSEEEFIAAEGVMRLTAENDAINRETLYDVGKRFSTKDLCKKIKEM